MTLLKKYKITVPCSSANIGPGFDVLGIALSLYLTLCVSMHSHPDGHDSFNCKLVFDGEGKSIVSLETNRNIITRTALYVLKCHGIAKFPAYTTVHINNQIPIGRGLGSSGAAIVAGVLLGNVLGQLNLSKNRMMDYTLTVERHPDNVTASMVGGFVGSCCQHELDTKDSEVSNGKQPPMNIGHYIKFGWANEIKAIAVIPNFQVATATSRQVLPSVYPKQDLIFNLQRLAFLTTSLGKSPPEPHIIYNAMQDRVHQPYRAKLIPGLQEILSSLTPETDKGLLGICLSGAGPTILALAVSNFDSIAENITKKFNAYNIECAVKVLDIDKDGSQAHEILF